jgi:hypothetical protein
MICQFASETSVWLVNFVARTKENVTVNKFKESPCEKMHKRTGGKRGEGGDKRRFPLYNTRSS